jgi:hypothetical protein
MVTPNRDHHAMCGIVAGFVGTAVVSAAMILLMPIGLAPDIIGLIAHILQSSRDNAWMVHFLVGTVAWGGLFAILQPFLPSPSPVIRGMMFSVAAWLAMMLVMMPMADAGYFGFELGILTPVTTLFLHLIFGAAMGVACAVLPMADYHRGPGGMLRRGF